MVRTPTGAGAAQIVVPPVEATTALVVQMMVGLAVATATATTPAATGTGTTSRCILLANPGRRRLRLMVLLGVVIVHKIASTTADYEMIVVTKRSMAVMVHVGMMLVNGRRVAGGVVRRNSGVYS